jgi:predicted MFS family arabinose efflux permease
LNICGNALGALLMGWLFQYVGVNPTLIAIGVAAGLAADVLLLRDRQSGKPTPQAQKV